MTQDQRVREIDSFNHGKNLLVVKIPLLKRNSATSKAWPSCRIWESVG